MNIENIASLSQMLTGIGFDKQIAYRLMQHICFKPSSFTLEELVSKDKDRMVCSLFFERKDDAYECSFYDASFLKEINLPDITLYSVSIAETDQKMLGINWTDSQRSASFDLNNEATWKREMQIEQVLTDLSLLSETAEGKYYADCLKLKHWSLVPSLQSYLISLNSLRARFEVNQRFYFFEGKGISLEEAYRFLLNRWLEKKLLAQKKKEAGTVTDVTVDTLVVKKRKGKLKK